LNRKSGVDGGFILLLTNGDVALFLLGFIGI